MFLQDFKQMRDAISFLLSKHLSLSPKEERFGSDKLLEVQKSTLMLIVQVGGERSFGHVDFYVLAHSEEN